MLLRLNLSISNVRGQCYDGAATMSGAKSGVVTRLSAAEPRPVFTHCYGHSLNLACVDTIKWCKIMEDALDTTREIKKLMILSLLEYEFYVRPGGQSELRP